MLTKKLFHAGISIFLTSLFVLCIVSYSFAGGYIDATLSQDYLNTPGVGSNVTAYMIGEYRDPTMGATSIHLFVRRCESLKRLTYTSEGVFITYNQYLTLSEFESLLPETLVGMIDADGSLSTALAGEPGVIGVIENVLEYTKVNTRFAARVSIKFVPEAQSAEAVAH